MRLSGTVVAEASTLVEDGSVVVEGDRIVAVGERETLGEQYPDHREVTADVVMPGMVGAHIHSVQSLGRGTAEDRELLAETGTHVTHCPSSSMKLASGVAPVVDYLDREINVALGNDGLPCNNTLDPFTEMKQASTLQKVDRLGSTVTPAAAIFEMATSNGAKAAGFEQVGKLREGWRAAIIGLSTATTRATPLYDVLSHLVFAARGEDVTFTMVDGEMLMEDGEVTVADADAI